MRFEAAVPFSQICLNDKQESLSHAANTEHGSSGSESRKSTIKSTKGKQIDTATMLGLAAAFRLCLCGSSGLDQSVQTQVV